MDTGDLFKSLDALLVARKERNVRREPGQKNRVEWVPTRSLWEQLLEAQASDNSGGGRGKASPGSRAPLDLNITALLAEVTDSVVDALVVRGHHPRYQEGSARTHGLGIRIFDVPASLRQLAAVIRDLGDQELADHWARRYRSWVARAKTALGLDEDDMLDVRAVRLPGIGYPPCPDCGWAFVTADRDGEDYREPALVTQFRDGQVVHVTCRACNTGWWRGEGLEELKEQLAAALVDQADVDDDQDSEPTA